MRSPIQKIEKGMEFRNVEWDMIWTVEKVYVELGREDYDVKLLISTPTKVGTDMIYFTKLRELHQNGTIDFL